MSELDPGLQDYARSYQQHIQRAATLIGVTALASIGAATANLGYDRFSEKMQAGIVESYAPQKECSDLSPKSYIATLNAKGVTIPQVAKLIVDREVDVLSLQELRPSRVNDLRRAFPCYSVSYVLANGLLGGQKGNAIMVRGPVSHVNSFSITNSSTKDMIIKSPVKTIENVFKVIKGDQVSSGFASTGIVEKRSAIAVTTDLTINGKIIEAQFINGHIGREVAVRKKQRERLMGFIASQIKKNPNTFYCGDLNTNPSLILGPEGEFAKIGMKAERTGNTYVRGTSVVDYCAHSLKSVAKLAYTVRDKIIKTDHHPVISEIVPREQFIPESIWKKIQVWFRGY